MNKGIVKRILQVLMMFILTGIILFLCAGTVAWQWDRILSVISIIPYGGVYVLSGLDYRFYWSIEYDACLHGAALLCYCCASMLTTWAMISNRFFSTMVRLQKDRGHQVARGGPYRYVRHPGYVGFIITYVTAVLVLGSLYGVAVAAISVLILIIRTDLEDKTLQAELEGYAEYSQQVRYRPLPYIW